MNFKSINRYYKQYTETDRKEYYKQFLININMLEYLCRKTGIEKITEIKAQVKFNEIHFGNIPKSIKKKLGCPNFKINNSPYATLVYFYKEFILNFEVISQLHFINNEFSFAAKTFISHTDEYKLIIKDALIKKYLPESSLMPYSINSSNRKDGIIYLKDMSGNQILFIEDVFLHVLYFSSKVDILKFLSEFKMIQKQKEDMKANAVFEKLAKCL